MPRKNHHKCEKIQCPHFLWRLYLRNQIFCADGRSNTLNLGRHSLGVSTHEEAVFQLQRLDHAMAVKHRLVAEPAEAKSVTTALAVEAGIEYYMKHVGRSPVLGAPRMRPLRGMAKSCESSNGSSSVRISSLGNK